MKHVLFLSLFLLSFLTEAIAQGKLSESKIYEYTAMYNLVCKPDSTTQKERTADMVLLSDGKNSLFADYGNLCRDTARLLAKASGNRLSISDWKKLPKFNENFKYKIIKLDNDIITYDKIAVLQSPTFKYTERKADLKWNVLDDTATIFGYQCQKAECNYGGRDWTAWFTATIPITDGPYKFCGLPGLIIQLSDSQNYWVFSLSSFEQKTYRIPDNLLPDDAISVNKSKFMKLLRDSYANGFVEEQVYGMKFLNQVEKQKEYYRERAKTENNWIER